MIEINNIKLTTPVLELELSAKLLNRLKISQVNNFEQMMKLDISKWENVVAAKVISAMNNARNKYKEQYEKLLAEQQKAQEVKQPTSQPEVSSDPQLDGEAYSRMTNTSFAVPSTYDQRRFFVANNILNAYVLSGRLQDEEGPLPVVMREIVKVADAFMDAFDGKPYVEEEDEEEEDEIIVPISTVVDPAATQQKSEQKQEQKQKSSNNQKKDKKQKQSKQKQESQKTEAQKQEAETAPLQPAQSYEIPDDFGRTPLEVIDVIEDEEGITHPLYRELIEIPDIEDIPEEPEETHVDEVEEVKEEPAEDQVEDVEVEEVEPSSTSTETEQPDNASASVSDIQHPNAERGQNIRIADYLGRGKRGSKYFKPGDVLTVKRMKLGDDGLIVVSATINGKNVCFDSKHYTWNLE